jgi:hypothetical protein
VPRFFLQVHSVAGTVLVAATLIATTMGRAPAARAQERARSNYVFETVFDVRPDAVADFDSYWKALKDIGSDGDRGPRRFVDGAATGARRRVTLPVSRLAEYGFDRRNEAMLRAALGDQAAAILIQQFNQAQISRTSYLRQYRDDLSVRREHEVRTAATEVAYVSVTNGKEALFERTWRTVRAAYAKMEPHGVISVARTLVGGGPQYVIARSVREGGQAIRLEDPAAAVLAASGPDTARDVGGMLAETGAMWRVETYRNLGYDIDGDEPPSNHP